MRRQRGFTLIEMLIAMVISAVVLTMVVSVFRRQERSYALQNEVTERQQNVRVALDAIVRDLRLAGHGTSFISNPNIDLDGDGAADSLILAAVDNSPANAGNDIADGTDVVTIVYAGTPHMLLTGPPSEYAQGTNLVLASLDLDGDGYADFAPAGATTPMPFGLLYDFSRASAFRVTATAGNTCTINPGGPATYSAGAYVSPLKVIRYWVDNKNCHGTADALDPVMPRLVRENFGRDTGPETVAENITNLQLQYGVDRNHDGTIDAWVDDFSQPTDRPQDVLAVRVWVLGRNPTPRPGYIDQMAAQMGNVAVGPEPLYVRQLLTTEVQMRNKR